MAYTGTFDTEYDASLKREQNNYSALGRSLAALRQKDEDSLLQSRNYETGQLGKSLASAQKASYGQYKSAQRTAPIAAKMQGYTGGALAQQRARLQHGYQGARTAAQQSHDQSYSDVMQQWQQGKVDIASRYGQMDYQNMQNMYNNATTNAWTAYNTGLTKDQNDWTRQNTSKFQDWQQADADRNYEFAQRQMEENKRLQNEQSAVARQLADAQLAAARR